MKTEKFNSCNDYENRLFELSDSSEIIIHATFFEDEKYYITYGPARPDIENELGALK